MTDMLSYLDALVELASEATPDEDGLPDDDTWTAMQHVLDQAEEEDGEGVQEAKDATGHEHKGKGPGGGQFVAGGGGGGGGEGSAAEKPGAGPAQSRQYRSIGPGKDWGKQHWQDWADQLAPREKQAIDAYKQDSTPINQVLREDTHYRNAAHEEHKKALTRLLARSSVPEDVVGFRGAAAEFYDHLRPGQVFQDKGFVSTSVNKETMASFGDPHDEGTGVVRIAILIPKGSQGAYVSQHNNKDYSDELLLQRGSRFKVLKREGNRIVLKLLPRKKTKNA